MEKSEKLIIQYPIIIIYASIMNLVWGSLLLYDPAAGHTSTLHDLFDFFTFNLWYILLIVGTIALIPIARPMHWLTSLLMLLPQQTLILVSLVTALTAMFNGTFADGVPRPHSFIIADQFPAVLIAILHVYSLLETFRNPRWI